jgi:hypothetical protein
MRRSVYNSHQTFTDADFQVPRGHFPRTGWQIAWLTLGLFLVPILLASLFASPFAPSVPADPAVVAPQVGPPTAARPAQPDVQAFVLAAGAICTAEYFPDNRIRSEGDIILMQACIRAYLAREGIQLPR